MPKSIGWIFQKAANGIYERIDGVCVRATKCNASCQCKTCASQNEFDKDYFTNTNLKQQQHEKAREKSQMDGNRLCCSFRLKSVEWIF